MTYKDDILAGMKACDIARKWGVSKQLISEYKKRLGVATVFKGKPKTRSQERMDKWGLTKEQLAKATAIFLRKRQNLKRTLVLFTITHEEIPWTAVCPHTGIVLDYNITKFKEDHAVVLSLINKNLHWVKGNVEVISGLAAKNKLKTS